MATKIKLDKKGKFYGYLKSGKYVREELNDRRNCKEYRVKPIKQGVKLLLCITKKKGKEGGKTKALSILRDINIDLRKYKSKTKIKNILKKARKIKNKN